MFFLLLLLLLLFFFFYHVSVSLFGCKISLSKCNITGAHKPSQVSCSLCSYFCFHLNDPYLCFFVSFPVSHLGGPDPFQWSNSCCGGFLLWTLKVEIQHNRNVLHHVIAWSLQQRTSKKKFLLYVSCVCYRVGRFLPPGGRNRIKPRFKPSRKK